MEYIYIYYVYVSGFYSSFWQSSGTIGYNKYVYFGKHSEGNRFIRNEDL